MPVNEAGGRTQEDGGADAPRAAASVLRGRMRITIELHDVLTRFSPGGQPRLELELPAPVTVLEALARLGIGPDEPWSAALDGRLAAPSDLVRDGARLIVFSAIEGG